ncbi:MAG: YIP1 family protein [Rhodobacteraceae bacterium]|nr:YIP1 family protein [Paracoccaceae bacterium]
MSVGGDILQSWWAPGRVAGALLAGGPREARALAHLLFACGLAFLAQWPRLVRAAAADPLIPLEARLGGALVAMLFLMPLVLYGVAAASHLVLRALGRPPGFGGARTALFWALFATSPAIVAQGLLGGLLPAPAAGVAGGAVLALFLWIWGAGLAAAGAIALRPPTA